MILTHINNTENFITIFSVSFYCSLGVPTILAGNFNNSTYTSTGEWKNVILVAGEWSYSGKPFISLSSDISGTQVYEWYINSVGGSGYTIWYIPEIHNGSTIYTGNNQYAYIFAWS